MNHSRILYFTYHIINYITKIHYINSLLHHTYPTLYDVDWETLGFRITIRLLLPLLSLFPITIIIIFWSSSTTSLGIKTVNNDKEIQEI